MKETDIPYNLDISFSREEIYIMMERIRALQFELVGIGGRLKHKEQECAELTRLLSQQVMHLEDRIAHLDIVEKENSRLREALEYYASLGNWDLISDGNARCIIDPVDQEQLADKWCDVEWTGGKRARQALKGGGE